LYKNILIQTDGSELAGKAVEHGVALAKAIVDTATSEGCDLIPMASQGRRGVSAIILGSETAEMLTHSKDPGPRLSLRSLRVASR
jgi:nucleotide-binding universal stress UspA family protein